MSAPTLAERLAILKLDGRLGLAAVKSRVRRILPFAVRGMRAQADEFLFVPSDLRPTDPGLLDELRSGQMGLAGMLVEIGGGSPFAVQAAPADWLRELNGFSWLGSLRATGRDEAVALARRLVLDWCRRHRAQAGRRGIPAEPAVAARRIISWVSAAGFLLDDADAGFYRQFTHTLGLELRALDAKSRAAPPGYPRLVTLMAMLLACLAIKGHDRELPEAEARLLAELGQQFHADGGHLSRNADVVLEALIDLLPIRECYGARRMAVPHALSQSMVAMFAHLRLMSPVVGALARFNGAGASRTEALANILAFDNAPSPAQLPGAAASGYVRLERGETVVLVDCGRPPPLAFAGAAHAGCLSFEMAHAGRFLIVNGGAPGPAHKHARADARASVSHSTLVVDAQSSARLVRSRRLERLLAAPAIAGPESVTAERRDPAGAAELVATHDGYLARFGMIHERRLVLAEDGLTLDGIDILRPPRGSLRLARDVPVAVHFHLAEGADVEPDGQVAFHIAGRGGGIWRLAAKGCQAAIETATAFSESLGPSPARQIVLRAASPGETTISWRLERV